MTRFERDYNETKATGGAEVIIRRENEIKNLYKELKSCKNGFRRQCIMQDIARLQKQLDEIEKIFG